MKEPKWLLSTYFKWPFAPFYATTEKLWSWKMDIDVQQQQNQKKTEHEIGLFAVQLSFISRAKIKSFCVIINIPRNQKILYIFFSSFYFSQIVQTNWNVGWYWYGVIEGETLEIDDVQMMSMSIKWRFSIWKIIHDTSVRQSKHFESNKILFDR